MTLNGNAIEQVEKYKSLGVIFNTIRDIKGNMFKHNTEHLNNKARSAIFGVQKKLKYVGAIPANHMFYLYETLIQPILLYGSDIWGAYSQCTNDINNVFLWFIRCVLRVKATTCNIITIGESGIIPPDVKCH